MMATEEPVVGSAIGDVYTIFSRGNYDAWVQSEDHVNLILRR